MLKLQAALCLYHIKHVCEGWVQTMPEQANKIRPIPFLG